MPVCRLPPAPRTLRFLWFRSKAGSDVPTLRANVSTTLFGPNASASTTWIETTGLRTRGCSEYMTIGVPVYSKGKGDVLGSDCTVGHRAEEDVEEVEEPRMISLEYVFRCMPKPRQPGYALQPKRMGSAFSYGSIAHSD